MSNDTRINTVSRVGSSEPAPASTPGELVANEGPGGIPQWSFMGNGSITPTDVMGRIIDVEGKNDKALQPFGGNRDAATLTAQRYLLTQNRHLENQGANNPIPNGEMFYATTGPSLKDMLAPFANNLDRLRQFVSDSGLPSRENRATGNVPNRSRGLPTDPNI